MGTPVKLPQSRNAPVQVALKGTKRNMRDWLERDSYEYLGGIAVRSLFCEDQAEGQTDTSKFPATLEVLTAY